MGKTVSTKQAAEMLGVGSSTINRMIHRGELKAHKRTLATHAPFEVEVDSIERVLEQRQFTPTE